MVISPFRGYGDKRKSKDELIEGSAYQELPCYGYQFKTRNHSGVKKKKDGIGYSVNIEDISKHSIKELFKGSRFVRITLDNPNKEQVNNLFEALRRDVNQILNTFRELLSMDFLDQGRKWIEVSRLLDPAVYFPKKTKILSQSEEVHYFSDSDYLYIVEEMYKFDPEFFMSSIYPNLMSRKYAKYISEIDVKWEINTLVNKLNEESGV